MRWLSSTSSGSTRSNAARAASFAVGAWVVVTMAREPRTPFRRPCLSGSPTLTVGNPLRLTARAVSVRADHRADGPGEGLAGHVGQGGVGGAHGLGQAAGEAQAD